MDRERWHEVPFLDEDELVPDYLPDELLADHQDTAQATVASRATTGTTRRRTRPARRSRAAAAPRMLTDRRQRVHAVIGIVLGYAGVAAMTVWWRFLAQARPEPVWQWLTGLGAALLALATVSILLWLTLRLRARRRRRQEDQGRQAPVGAGSLP